MRLVRSIQAQNVCYAASIPVVYAMTRFTMKLAAVLLVISVASCSSSSPPEATNSPLQISSSSSLEKGKTALQTLRKLQDKTEPNSITGNGIKAQTYPAEVNELKSAIDTYTNSAEAGSHPELTKLLQHALTGHMLELDLIKSTPGEYVKSSQVDKIFQYSPDIKKHIFGQPAKDSGEILYRTGVILAGIWNQTGEDTRLASIEVNLSQ